MSLATLLRQRAEAGETLPKDTAVIFLFLHGGPSQLETYDLKPNAPTEIRGPCMPISTNVQGLSLCELLPMHSRMANRFSIIRSCTHGDGGHFEAHGRFMMEMVCQQINTGQPRRHFLVSLAHQVHNRGDIVIFVKHIAAQQTLRVLFL